jgi:chemotaxis protein MotB
MLKRKEKVQETGDGFPSWMITFSDMVTLMMTFFIVLVSMASMTDVYKRKVALGSVSGTFGTGAPGLDDLTTDDTRTRVDPGPINVFKDLSPVRDRLQEDPDKDLRFESNRFIQRLSMDAAALFAPGTADLTDRGRELLARVLPIVAESAYPLGLSGHTAGGMDEFGPEYLPKPWVKVDFSWDLSLARVLAVYRYFLDAGIAPDKLRLEAFGRFRPRVGDESREDRQTNRRVEITLDRRIGSWSSELAARKAREEEDMRVRDSFSVDDFLFRFDLPGRP